MGQALFDGFAHAAVGRDRRGDQLPRGGGAVWGGAVDGDPLAGAQASHRQRPTQAPGWRYALAPCRAAPAGYPRAMEGCQDITLDELRVQLAGKGLVAATSTLHRFFVRHRITREKKTGHAIEQDRPDILQAAPSLVR